MSAAGRRDGWCSAEMKSRYASSTYRTQCALLLTVFAEVEPLCRPQADAMGGAL